MAGMNSNRICFCESAHFGPAVQKTGVPSHEANALKEYSGKRFCKFFEYDAEHGILLMEHIRPGTPLRAEPDIEKRLSVFLSLYDGLHITPQDPSIYPTYMQWVSKIAAYMRGRSDYPKLCAHMQKAEALCLRLHKAYNRRMLLHGDFHHDNILLDHTGAYRIIDPKGVVGDPLFDLPRFILNEEGICEEILRIMDYFARVLHIPGEVIRQCYYIEAAMAQCWCVESNETPDLEAVRLAERIILYCQSR